MKTFCFILCWLGLAAASAKAQSYSIDRFTISGGGGVSSGGGYSVTGIIGQPAAGALNGGDFVLQSGLGGWVAAIQTPGAPTLSLELSNRVVIISWPQPATGFGLQSTTALGDGANTVWTSLPGPFGTNQTHWLHLEPAPVGSKFYRLHRP